MEDELERGTVFYNLFRVFQGLGHVVSRGEGGDGRSAGEVPCIEGEAKVLDEPEGAVRESVTRTIERERTQVPVRAGVRRVPLC